MAQEPGGTQRTTTEQAAFPETLPAEVPEAVELPPYPAPSSWKMRLGAWLEDKLERLAKSR